MVWTDYLLALPITLLVLFALGILLIDFMLPKDMKWANADPNVRVREHLGQPQRQLGAAPATIFIRL